MSGAYRVNGGDKTEWEMLIGKAKEETLIGRPRRRWENNIKVDFSN
jgi:hypothetical protein